jgi:hypothetical protein
VTHPFADAGRWETETEPARFVVTGSYLQEGPFQVTIERDGLTMIFDGTAYPLQSYASAFEAGGLLIEAIREPKPAKGRVSDGQWCRLPMFLMLRALKP